MTGIDVELVHGRQFEVPAEFESDIIENRLEKTPVPDLGFDLARHIQGFRQNLQITEFKLSLAVGVFEKCLKGNTQERACNRLKASPFPADLLHCGITPVLPFTDQTFYHPGRDEQQQDQDADGNYFQGNGVEKKFSSGVLFVFIFDESQGFINGFQGAGVVGCKGDIEHGRDAGDHGDGELNPRLPGSLKIVSADLLL